MNLLTPGSPGKFLMAAFVRFYAQKVTAEIYPVQPIVMCSKGRCASRTEYAPKHHNLARIIDATTASTNAEAGVNATDNAENKTPNAPSLRCKLAELANADLAIGSPY